MIRYWKLLNWSCYYFNWAKVFIKVITLLNLYFTSKFKKFSYWSRIFWKKNNSKYSSFLNKKYLFSWAYAFYFSKKNLLLNYKNFFFITSLIWNSSQKFSILNYKIIFLPFYQNKKIFNYKSSQIIINCFILNKRKKNKADKNILNFIFLNNILFTKINFYKINIYLLQKKLVN